MSSWKRSFFSDPMYLNVNDSFLAIRKETAALIVIEKTNG